jgi:hypothetical protein
VVYSYQFRLFHQLRHYYNQEPTNNLSLPYFLLQSLKEMSAKVKRGKHEFLAHHGLIKLIVSYAMRNMKHRILWVDFLDMDKKYFLEIQEEMMQQSQEKEGEEKFRKYKKVSRPRSSR